MLSGNVTTLQKLLPRYAEFGLHAWLEQVYTVIPESPHFLDNLLKETARLSHPTTVGHVLGKILDLIARGIVHSDITEDFSLPFADHDLNALRAFASGLREHANKVITTQQFHHSRFQDRPAPSALHCALLQTIWLALEKAATTTEATSHICSTLLLLWRDPAYTPIVDHHGGLGGFYRIPLAALLLQAAYVEPVYRGILDWHRSDTEPGWNVRHPYEPYASGDCEGARQHCFKLLCPEYDSAYEIWRQTAEKHSYPELCAMLRMATSEHVNIELPQDF